MYKTANNLMHGSGSEAAQPSILSPCIVWDCRKFPLYPEKLSNNSEFFDFVFKQQIPPLKAKSVCDCGNHWAWNRPSMKQFNCKTGSFWRLIEEWRRWRWSWIEEKKKTRPPLDLLGHSLHTLSTVWTHLFDMRGGRSSCFPCHRWWCRLTLLCLMIFTDANWTDASQAAVTDSYDGKLTRTAWLTCVGGRAHSRVDEACKMGMQTFRTHLKCWRSTKGTCTSLASSVWHVEFTQSQTRKRYFNSRPVAGIEECVLVPHGPQGESADYRNNFNLILPFGAWHCGDDVLFHAGTKTGGNKRERIVKNEMFLAEFVAKKGNAAKLTSWHSQTGNDFKQLYEQHKKKAADSNRQRKIKRKMQLETSKKI